MAKAERQIFFCGRGGWDEPGAWCELADLKKVRAFFRGNELVEPHLPKKPFRKLLVLRFNGPEEDGRLYSWGEDQPGFQASDFSDHEGTKVVVDGKTVFNDVRPAGDEAEIEEHDPSCEDCAE
jgi:hypothetical protein